MEPVYIIVVILFLILGLSTYLAFRKYTQMLMVFLFALLIHELILRWSTNLFHLPGNLVTLLSLWKECVLAVLVVAAIWRLRGNFGRFARTLNQWPLLIWGMLLFWGIVASIISPDRMAGLAGFRDYFEPMLVLGLTVIALPELTDHRRFTNVWLAIGVGMALLGIWQGAFWGQQDYIMYGFGTPAPEAGMAAVMIDGQRILRPVSTVTGPNELGFHMILFSLFTLKHLVFGKKKVRVIGTLLFILFSTCLFYTRSRSDLIAYGICVALVGIISYRGFSPAPRRNLILWLSVALIGVLLIGGVLYATGMVGFILRTVQNLRSEYHVIDITEAIAFLMANPGGVGMGFAGPRIGAFFPETPAFHAEGSLFQIALDMGVFGLVLWLAFIISLMSTIYRRMRSNKNDFTRAIQSTAVIGWIGGLFVFLILPLMQSMTLMSWMWFLLGLACQAAELERTRAS